MGQQWIGTGFRVKAVTPLVEAMQVHMRGLAPVKDVFDYIHLMKVLWNEMDTRVCVPLAKRMWLTRDQDDYRINITMVPGQSVSPQDRRQITAISMDGDSPVDLSEALESMVPLDHEMVQLALIVRRQDIDARIRLIRTAGSTILPCHVLYYE